MRVEASLVLRTKYLAMTRSNPDIASSKSQQFTIRRIDKIFKFYRPKPPLSNFVDSLWIHEGHVVARQTERILPTGTFELAFNLRQNALGFYDPERPDNRCRLSGAVVSGAHGRGFAPESEGEASIIGVHFKPGGAFPFLRFPADDLADTHVDLETLWGSSAGRLRERLCESRTSDERFQLLHEALLSRLRIGVEQHYAVSAALEIFGKSSVKPTVREAAKYIGLSQRRFIQVFKEEVGMTPKLFSRVQRFQQARTLMDNMSSSDWINIAMECGYFDQSHLINDFRFFSNLSPAEYVHQRIQSVNQFHATLIE